MKVNSVANSLAFKGNCDLSDIKQDSQNLHQTKDYAARVVLAGAILPKAYKYSQGAVDTVMGKAADVAGVVAKDFGKTLPQMPKSLKPALKWGGIAAIMGTILYGVTKDSDGNGKADLFDGLDNIFNAVA